MRYADWKAQREQIEAKIKDLYTCTDPRFSALGEEQLALDRETRRDYQISDRVTLIVHADWFYLMVKDGSRLQQHDVNLDGLTVEDLEIAIEAIKMRDRWRSGELAELPPSGSWPK